jgi:hypothetical protein
MPKRRRAFTESLEAQYPFLNEDKQAGKVLYSICYSQFPIEHGSHSNILQHIKKRKHTIAAETKSCSKKVVLFYQRNCNQ